MQVPFYPNRQEGHHMNTESQGKLEVSSSVVDQLNSMVRNSAAPGVYGAGADLGPGPGPSPTNQPQNIDSTDRSSQE